MWISANSRCNKFVWWWLREWAWCPFATSSKIQRNRTTLLSRYAPYFIGIDMCTSWCIRTAQVIERKAMMIKPKQTPLWPGRRKERIPSFLTEMLNHDHPNDPGRRLLRENRRLDGALKGKKWERYESVHIISLDATCSLIRSYPLYREKCHTCPDIL